MMFDLLLSTIRNAIDEDIGTFIMVSTEFREDILRVYLIDDEHHNGIDRISIMRLNHNDNFIVVRLLLLKDGYNYSMTISYIFNIDDSLVDNILAFIRDVYNGNAVSRWRLWRSVN